MALLSATQGTPERVWSLLSILSAHGGQMERQELVAWLNPRFLHAGQESKDEKSAADQTIQAALGLGLIDTSERQFVRLLGDPVPERFLEFGDLIHDKLITLPEDDADAVLLEVFAWLAVQVEIQGSMLWVDDWSADQFADQANAALTPREGSTGERRFNTTKRAPWRRWIELVGLRVSLPSGEDYPCVTTRLERELFNGMLPFGQEISADMFLRHVAQRLPYLDGGRLFQQMTVRLGYRVPPRTVSRLLSTALRDLHEDGRLTLIVRGDAKDNFELARDRFSRLNSFGAVVLNQEQELA